MRHVTGSEGESLRCSFCHKPQEGVGKLISSPRDYPRAYICDECVAVCADILEDDKPDVEAPSSGECAEPHPLLSHPLASELMGCIVQWIRQESLGHVKPDELGRMRDIAVRMITSESNS